MKADCFDLNYELWGFSSYLQRTEKIPPSVQRWHCWHTDNTFSEKKIERTHIAFHLDVLFMSDSLSITWCEDQVEPSHKPSSKAFFQHFCAESCMKSYGCKLHPDQNLKLYKPAVQLHLSPITDPPCGARGTTALPLFENMELICESLSLTDVLQEELPTHVKSPK